MSGFLRHSGRCALLLPVAASVLVAQSAPDAAAPATASSQPVSDEVITLDALEVQGIKEGMARAIDEQRAANNVVNVLAADSIGRFPDLNLADSLGRVSGLSIERDQGEARFVNIRGTPSDYTSVAIDGITMPSPTTGARAMRLDTIPSDIVGTLEVTKAITPDIDSDNIGGHVNIRTQGSFDQPGRAIRTNLGIGYNELGGGDITNVGLTYSDRFLENKNLGILLSVSDFETDRHTANIETNTWRLVPGETDLFRPGLTDTRTYELVRSRSSYSGRIDFKPTENTYVFFSTIFSDWSDDELRDNYRLPFTAYTPGSTFPAGGATAVAVDSNHNIRDVVNTINAYTIGAEHMIGDAKLDFSVTLGTASVETKRPNSYYNFRVAPGARPDVNYDFSNPDLPTITRVSDSNLLMSPPEDMEFLRYEQRQENTDDDDLTIALNYEVPSNLFNRETTLKFGAKFKDKEKVRDESRTRWNAADIPFAVNFTDIIGSELATNFGQYPWGFKTDRGASAALAQQIRASGPGTDLRNIRFGNFYEVTEEIYAGYGMATTEFGDLTVVAGTRVEHTKNTGSAFQTDDNWVTATPANSSNDYTDVFPSLHFVYKLSENQTLKLSFSTALARANFATLRPNEVVDDTNLTISAGNPDIDATKAYSVDLYYDYYIQPIGIFTAGVFAKKIDDPIFSGTSLSVRNGDTYTVTQDLNGSDGELYGFELNFERPFTFLPAPFDGFGMFANYTYTNSSAELPRNPDGTSRGRVDLQGSSEQTYNVAIFYERGGYNARLSYLYRSEWLDAFNLNTPALTRFWDERPQLDFTASVPLNRWASIYFQANNLTDERGRRFLGNRTRVYELEGFGASYMIGAKLNF
jgi:TonB-dependent receptor